MELKFTTPKGKYCDPTDDANCLALDSQNMECQYYGVVLDSCAPGRIIHHKKDDKCVAAEKAKAAIASAKGKKEQP